MAASPARYRRRVRRPVYMCWMMNLGGTPRRIRVSRFVQSAAPAWAKAEIISPFQAVRILSSRCGRIRLDARFAAGSARDVAVFASMYRRPRFRRIENVLAGEFAMRIVLHVAGVPPIAVAELARRGSPSNARSHPPPRYRRRLRLSRADGRDRSRYRRLRPNRSRRRGGSCRAARSRACCARRLAYCASPVI